MIDKTAKHFEQVATKLGLTIKIPRPNQTTRKVFGTTNALVGTALLASGSIYKNPSLMLLGALSVLGAVVLICDKQ